MAGASNGEKGGRSAIAWHWTHWKAWFGDEGGARDGGPDDPRLALILVDVESVSYLKVDKPRPIVLFEVAKAMVTGTPPDVGVERQVSGEEIDRGR